MSGRLLYLMGASGAGKDSLLHFVRGQIRAAERIVVAHRYITRPPSEGENHIALSAEEFTVRETGGLFAFTWRSHGFHYGIGIEIETWLSAGFTVVINGSREAYATFLAARPDMVGILVTVPRDVLRERLVARGRESIDAINARLERNDAMQLPSGVIQIDNSGTLDSAGSALLVALRG